MFLCGLALISIIHPLVSFNTIMEVLFVWGGVLEKEE